MKTSKTSQQWWRAAGVTWTAVCVWGLVACSTGEQKPASPMVTPDEVRSHANGAFDRLKQEERERAEREVTPLSVPSR